MDNRYLIPGVVLAVALAMLGMAVSKIHRYVQTERAEHLLLTDELDQLQRNTAARNNALSVLTKSAEPANVFIQQWRGTLDPSRNGSSILEDLSRVAREMQVAVHGRKSGSQEYPWHGVPVRAQFAEATGVSPDYHRLVNWLGEVERTWPLGRIESLSFQQSGTSLLLSLKITYPTFLSEQVYK